MSEPGTEVPEEAPVGGEASPIPPVFWWSLWIPAFAVMVWGFQVLFNQLGRRTQPAPPRDEESTPAPEPPDP